MIQQPQEAPPLRRYQPKVEEPAAGNAPTLYERRTVNIITGGSSLQLNSNRRRKQFARQVHHIAIRAASTVPKGAQAPITFTALDASGVDFPHNDALVISASIAGCEVKRVLVDGGSSADLLFAEAFDKMMIPRDRLRPAAAPLQGFGKDPLKALGQINLAVIFENPEQRTRARHDTFDVVDLPYQYNAVLGRGTLNAFGAVPHHNYLCLKIPGPEGVITIRGDQDLARRLELRVTDPKQASGARDEGCTLRGHRSPHTPDRLR